MKEQKRVVNGGGFVCLCRVSRIREECWNGRVPEGIYPWDHVTSVKEWIQRWCLHSSPTNLLMSWTEPPSAKKGNWQWSGGAVLHLYLTEQLIRRLHWADVLMLLWACQVIILSGAGEELSFGDTGICSSSINGPQCCHRPSNTCCSCFLTPDQCLSSHGEGIYCIKTDEASLTAE